MVCLIAALAPWYALEVWAATVSTHTIGRYQILLQEGTPVSIGEVLGLVRRQTGLPEYPLMLVAHKRLLELSILGPGNRPIRLASTPFTWPTGARAATTRFIVGRSERQGEMLRLHLHQARSSRQLSLAVNLQQLERMLEGER